ncbi:MAG TPA: gamma-glutamyl-gamma-aminobutyrate hydrolase family protein [Verrucomicrobiae bacterium]
MTTSSKTIRPPVVLVTPDIEIKGREFKDLSLSLSANYLRAILRSGGVPLTMPATVSAEVIAECVRRCDGVMLTGGDDVDPRLYTDPGRLPDEVRRTVEVTPDGGERDYRELMLINEVFQQRKPLLAICRGHQLLNIALGGTLMPNIPTQRPAALNHRQTDKRSEVVHEVRLTPDSLLAKITTRQQLGVNSTHHQAVSRVAGPLRVTARSPDGMVEGLELKAGVGRMPFLVSVQFHPERLADRFAEHAAIFSAFTQACAHGDEHKI